MKSDSQILDEIEVVLKSRGGVAAPPSTGKSLIRLTAPDGKDLSHAYATVDPWNCLHTGLLLQHSEGRIGLHYPDGKFYMILPGVRHDTRNVWDRKNPNCFWMSNGNELRRYDVSTNTSELIRRFDHLDPNHIFNIVDIGKGEGDISEDGVYLPILADGRYAFLYRISTISTDTVGPAVEVEGLNAVYCSPANHLIVTGKNGVQMVRDDGKLIDVFYRQEHMDLGRDTDGSEILVILDDRDNCVYKISLADPTRKAKILSLGWSKLGGPSSMAVDVCCPAGKPYAVITTYGKDPDVKYANSILKVPFNQYDASTNRAVQVDVLAQHHSDTSTYEGQPKAVASGNQFLFDSMEDGLGVVYMGMT